jgi:AcrR family transcriptional regulator
MPPSIRASRLYTDCKIAAGDRLVNNHVTWEFPEIARKYTLKRRAERQDETRQKIVDAAVKLHTTIGPVHTTDLAIAERAGVTRRTFYRHFPDEVSLFKACTGHTMDTWPPPDSSPWRQISDPAERLAVALRELYAFYRVAGPGLIVIMRDAPLLRPALRPNPSRADLLNAMTDVLLEGWKARGRRRDVLRAAIGHATAVSTWQSLVVQQELTDEEAIRVLTGMVLEAGGAHDFRTINALNV